MNCLIYIVNYLRKREGLSIYDKLIINSHNKLEIAKQEKIDGIRDPKEKAAAEATVESTESTDSSDDEDTGFPDFITNLK